VSPISIPVPNNAPLGKSRTINGKIYQENIVDTETVAVNQPILSHSKQRGDGEGKMQKLPRPNFLRPKRTSIPCASPGMDMPRF
jgi:hypothetical protein